METTIVLVFNVDRARVNSDIHSVSRLLFCQHIPLCPLPSLHYYNSKQQSGITSYLYMSRFNMSLVPRHTFLLACRAHASHHMSIDLSSQHVPKACSSVPVFLLLKATTPNTRSRALSFVTWGISRFGGLPLSSPGKNDNQLRGEIFLIRFSVTPPHPLEK